MFALVAMFSFGLFRGNFEPIMQKSRADESAFSFLTDAMGCRTAYSCAAANWSASRRNPARHGVVEEGLLATIAALGAVVRQAREDGAEKAGQGFRLRSGSAERGPRAATPPCWRQDIARRFSSLTPRRH